MANAPIPCLSFMIPRRVKQERLREPGARVQVFVALLGLLLIFSGVWRLTARVLPNERKSLILRREVENFLGLIRTLNAQAVRLGREETETAKDHYRETIDALHAAVDRMAEVAGREG